MLPRNPLYEISHIHIVPARLKLLNALTRNAPALRRLALSINEYRSPQSAVLSKFYDFTMWVTLSQ